MKPQDYLTFYYEYLPQIRAVINEPLEQREQIVYEEVEEEDDY